MHTQNLQYAINDLLEQLEAVSPFVLAFSGGLDSRFIAHIAGISNIKFETVHISGPHVTKKETEYALAWLARHGIPVRVLEFNPLEVYDVEQSTKKRCYSCKKEMFTRVCSIADGRPVLDGTNATDLKQIRPGLRALKELGILSPLAVCGIKKEDIFILAKETGMDNPVQAPRPCMLTRFEYGMPPNVDLLRKIEATEQSVEGLGFSNFRLRLHKEGPAILQIAWDEIQKFEERRSCLKKILDEHGFEDAKLRAEITISGYFDMQ